MLLSEHDRDHAAVADFTESNREKPTRTPSHSVAGARGPGPGSVNTGGAYFAAACFLQR
jgi:hypothetical protein